LLLPVLRKEWHLSLTSAAVGLTLMNIGMPLGSFLQGYSDNIGRSKFVLLDAIILIVFGLASVVAPNFHFFVAIRFFYEIGVGICMPLTCAFTNEISPSAKKTSLLSRMWIIWVTGYLLSCLLGWLLLAQGEWRLMLLVLVLPHILGLGAYYLAGRESLHYLWVRGETARVHALANEMCELNG
jgi:MFS transporter, SP family, major inositol transporter